MPRTIASLCAVAALWAAWTIPAAATPNCLRGHQPYRLADDTVNWAMAIAPGADCIQGLRWSTMQIASVSIATPPHNGTIVIVGSGFRYFANLDHHKSSDRFTLVVSGKNRRDLGTSTVEVIVGPSLGYMASSLIEWCDACQAWTTPSPIEEQHAALRPALAHPETAFAQR